MSKASEILGVRRATLFDLLNEKSSLMPEMALRLEKAFHLSMEILLKLQAWHDATEIRKQAGESKVDPYVAA